MPKNFPFVFQSAVHDCVPACVLALSRHFKIHTTIQELRTILVTDPLRGTALKDLQRLKSVFDVQLGKLVNVDEIETYFPFIAYLNRGHAVVVWEYSPKRNFIVGDPSIGVIEIRQEDFLQQWGGLTAVLRPSEVVSVDPLPSGGNGQSSMRTFFEAIQSLLSLEINWKPMLVLSSVVVLLGGANALYSLLFARYLSNLSQFLAFISVYVVLSSGLGWLGGYVHARLTQHYAESLGCKIRDAFGTIDSRFYTMGDISTRYGDSLTVLQAVMGLFHDIPYGLVIFGASLYFLFKVSVLLCIFVLAFLVMLVTLLNPLVHKVQFYMYTIKLRQAEVTNKLQQFLRGAPEEVTSAWEDNVRTQYKQALWQIPLQTVVGNSVALPVLFVVIFMHWQTGGTAHYAQILSAVMIMNYAISAGHTLYGRYVGWQTAQPSLHRLMDFLSTEEQATEVALSTHSSDAAPMGDMTPEHS